MKMISFLRYCSLFLLLVGSSKIKAQDTTVIFDWKVTSKKVSDKIYELQFITKGADGWQLYAPNQLLSDVPTTEFLFVDSAIQISGKAQDSGGVKTIQSPIFNIPINVYEGTSSWKQKIQISGTVPAKLQGSLSYTYGRNDEFYPAATYNFLVPLEGGLESTTRIKISELDIKKPVNNCGDDDTADKSLMGIFLLGFLGGLIALITPCVFPLIPLTVSFLQSVRALNPKVSGMLFFMALAYLSSMSFLVFLFTLLIRQTRKC
jgi:thiol:disulfide interchange protein DsbD